MADPAGSRACAAKRRRGGRAPSGGAVTINDLLASTVSCSAASWRGIPLVDATAQGARLAVTDDNGAAIVTVDVDSSLSNMLSGSALG
jgi:hypothetical protein